MGGVPDVNMRYTQTRHACMNLEFGCLVGITPRALELELELGAPEPDLAMDSNR